MDVFTLIYSDPLYYIGVVMAIIAALGFVYFLAGVLPAAHHLLLLDGHDDHMSHYRHRIERGLGIMVEMFMVWEIIRLIANFLLDKPLDNLGLVIFMLVVYGLVLLGSKITGSKPAGGH